MSCIFFAADIIYQNETFLQCSNVDHNILAKDLPHLIRQCKESISNEYEVEKLF